MRTQQLGRIPGLVRLDLGGRVPGQRCDHGPGFAGRSGRWSDAHRPLQGMIHMPVNSLRCRPRPLLKKAVVQLLRGESGCTTGFDEPNLARGSNHAGQDPRNFWKRSPTILPQRSHYSALERRIRDDSRGFAERNFALASNRAGRNPRRLRSKYYPFGLVELPGVLVRHFGVPP